MFQSLKRYGVTMLLLGMMAFLVSDGSVRQSVLGPVEKARAGAITISGAGWAVSSNTLSASDLTYTHTFTVATAVPANTGRIEIRLDSASGVPPSFQFAKIGSTSTAALVGRTLQMYPDGCCGMIMGIQLGATGIAAGTTVSLVLTTMVNPPVGGAWATNTYTLNNGTILDGNKSGGVSNGEIRVGTLALTVNITDTETSTAIAGYPVEIHPQACCGMWRTKTNATGQATFYGVPAGTYVLEQGRGVDPNNPDSSRISQYVSFDPQNVTIPAGAAVNISVGKSNKTITVTVVRDDGTKVNNANVNAFVMDGGGFAFGQTNSNGQVTLRTAVKSKNSNVMVNVMPSFGPAPVPGGQPSTQTDFVQTAPTPVSFVSAPNVAEAVSVTLTVNKPDATVTGKIVKPDGTAASGGGGAMNFRAHQFQPLFMDSTGTFTFKTSTKSAGGKWKLTFFDPSNSFSMPETDFQVNAGVNNLGTITLKAYDGSITAKTYRVDSGADVAMSGVPIMAFDSKQPGPPTMGFSGSDGTATIKVFKGKTYRLMANPGSSGGPGQRGGGEPNKIALRDTLFNLNLIERASAQASGGPSGPSDGNQMFPITPPQKASSGDTVTFKFDKATIGLTFATKTPAGTLVTDGAFVGCRPTGSGEFFGGGFGGPTAGGSGSVKITKGKFSCSAFFPPDSQYSGQTKDIEVTGAASVDLTVVQKTVTITGEIQDASSSNAKITGTTLKNLNLMIGAFWPGGMGMGSVDMTNGTYTIKVPFSTDVHVGVAPQAALFGGQSDYVPSMSDKALNGADGATLTHHLTLKKVDATISVTIKDNNGKAVEGIAISANNKMADIVGKGEPGGPGGPGVPGEGPEFAFSSVTDSTGKASIKVAPDTYNLSTNAREKGLFLTNPVNVEIASGETKEVTINLVIPDATLKVEVDNQSGADLSNAEVEIFNDDGTIAFSIIDGDDDDLDGKVNGTVEVKVPADTYNVTAGLDTPETGKVEESPTKKIELVKDETETTNLKTVTESDALPAPITSDVSASAPATLSLTKGGVEQMRVDIPTSAFSSGTSSSEDSSSSSSSGTSTVTVVPIEATATDTKADTAIKGMEISALDSSGNEITSLSSQIQGAIHYDDADIPAGMTEDTFVARAEVKSFNEDSGNWESLVASDCNKATNTCSFTTNHLTEFAIVASTDTTAPAAPKSVSVKNGSNNTAVLDWTKPTDTDFASVKVYRSTASGTLGSVVKSGVTDATYTDSGLTTGTKYYYTLHSVDTTGNESANTDQVSVVSAKLPLTGSINQTSDGSLIRMFSLVLAGLGALTAIGYRMTRNGSN